MILKESKSYKKSLKKYRHNKPVIKELRTIINLLLDNETIPSKYRDHELQGEFKGTQELHLKSDDLLLYMKIKEEVLYLVALGSHSEIF